MDYKLAAHSFNERLSWVLHLDDKLGFLSDDTTQELSLNCSVQESVKTQTSPFVEGGFIGSGSIGLSKYTLICWTEAMTGLDVDQECELTKYGRVRVLNTTQVGEYGRYGEILVEKI